MQAVSCSHWGIWGGDEDDAAADAVQDWPAIGPMHISVVDTHYQTRWPEPLRFSWSDPDDAEFT